MTDADHHLCRTCFEAAVQQGTCTACGAAQAEPNRDRRALPVWTIVGGKYRVGKVLGAGGFGITYLAQDIQLLRRAALKEYFPGGLVARTADRFGVECNSAEDKEHFDDGLDRFFREGKLLALFSHPNIVRVYEVIQSNGTAYLAMEFLDGFTLKAWLESVGRLETKSALDVMVFIVDALRAVHRSGVVHRDLKPDNVYVTNTGRTLLLDFGGAKQLASVGEKSMVAMFAHGYAAPEQYFAGSESVGPWTDVYACGATLFKLLTGRTLRGALERLAADPPLDWAPSDAPIPVRQAIERAVALRHADRFQNVEDFAAALIAPPAPTPAPTPAPPPRRPPPVANKAVLAGFAAFALAMIIVAGTAWNFWPPQPPKEVDPQPVTPGPDKPKVDPQPVEIDAALKRMAQDAAAGRWHLVNASARDARQSVPLDADPKVAPNPKLLAAAEAAIGNGNYRYAADIMRRATTERPGDWQSWSMLSYALLRLGQSKDAEIALTNGQRIRPEDARNWAILAEIRADKDPSEALAALQLAVYLASNRTAAMDYLKTNTYLSNKLRALVAAQVKSLESLPERAP
jgi:serine/threonine protein kinase